MADVSDAAKIKFYDDLCDKVRDGWRAIGVMLDDGQLRVTGIVVNTPESDFDRKVRAAAETLRNTATGVAVGLNGTQLVILAPAVDLPA